MRIRHAFGTAVLTAGLLMSTALVSFAATSGVEVAGDVWLDLDGDGVRDTDDPGRAGVSVTLRTSATILDATVTGDDGVWRFTNVAPGSYTLVVNPPIDHRITAGEQTVSIEVGSTNITSGPSLGLGSPVSSGTDVAVTVGANAATSSASTFGWTLDVYNLGDTDADGPISVRIVLDGAHAASAASGVGWTCDVADAIITCANSNSLAAAGTTSSIEVLSAVTGSVGDSARLSGTVRLDGAFDAAPLNDEASAERTVGTELAAPDTDGDGASDLTNTGAPTLALILMVLLALATGATTLRASRTA